MLDNRHICFTCGVEAKDPENIGSIEGCGDCLLCDSLHSEVDACLKNEEITNYTEEK